jgi:hypothetical protein
MSALMSARASVRARLLGSVNRQVVTSHRLIGDKLRVISTIATFPYSHIHQRVAFAL